LTKRRVILSSHILEVMQPTGETRYSLSELIFQRFPSRGRKRDVPEVWRDCGEFYRNQKSLRIFNGRSCHSATLFLSGAFVDEIQLRIHRKIFCADKHGPVVVYRCRGRFHRDLLSRDRHLQHHRNLNDHPLAAATFFRRLKLRSYIDLQRLPVHSSNPQKSIVGWISSIPNSHPSGRSFPFQTMTAEFVSAVAKLTIRSDCSTSRLARRTTRQPYGPTTRVKPSSRHTGVASLCCHSIATGTREFKRIPRRFRFTFGVAVVPACGCTHCPRSDEATVPTIMVRSRSKRGQWYAGTAEEDCASVQSITAVNSVRPSAAKKRLSCGPSATIRSPVASSPNPGTRAHAGRAARPHSKPARVRCPPPFRACSSPRPGRV
jgi:hypothetical protein